MSRRRFLHLTMTIVAAAALTTACGPTETEDPPMDAEQILAEAGFSAPSVESQVADGPLKGEEKWNKVVTFSGTTEEIDGWISENFAGGIESRAYRDDEQIAVAQLGEGVQKKDDRIASGTNGSIVFVVVVGQEAEPVVRVAVRRTGR